MEPVGSTRPSAAAHGVSPLSHQALARMRRAETGRGGRAAIPPGASPGTAHAVKAARKVTPWRRSKADPPPSGVAAGVAEASP